MKYWRQLDGWRTVAVMLVMLQHFFPDIGYRTQAGFIGVNLFFVLSGLLITSRLDQTSTSFSKTLGNFYIYRLARIVPVYFLVILIMYTMNVQPVRQYAMHCLLFIFNYDIVTHRIPLTPITHFWSLAVEMQFYILWPLLMLPLKKNRVVLQWLLISIIMLAFGQFYLSWVPALIPYRWVSLFPLVSMTSGALAYYIYMYSRSWLRTVGNRWIDGMVIAGVCWVVYVQHWTLYLVLTVASVYMLERALYRAEDRDVFSKMLGNAVMTYLGKISYGIYLFHLPILFAMRSWIPSAGNISIIISTTILTIASAALSYHYFEEPLRKKIRSWVEVR